MTFEAFPKIARFSREVFITEKIDGTNAQILIREAHGEAGVLHGIEDGVDTSIEIDGVPCLIRAGSRNRWLSVQADNFDFALWVRDNAADLARLGLGRHYGEWWGAGIQRGYGLKEKRFSLFNLSRWADDAVRPACCHVVPTIWRGTLNNECVDYALTRLRSEGSFAAPGFMKPEGIIIYHTAANKFFKKTLEKDDQGKEWGA